MVSGAPSRPRRLANDSDPYRQRQQLRIQAEEAERIDGIKRNKKKFRDFFKSCDHELPVPRSRSPSPEPSDPSLLSSRSSMTSTPCADSVRSITPTHKNTAQAGSPPQPDNGTIVDKMLPDFKQSLRDILRTMGGNGFTLKAEMSQFQDDCLTLSHMLEHGSTSDQPLSSEYIDVVMRMKRDLNTMSELLRCWSQKSMIHEQLMRQDIHTQLKIMQDQFSRHLNIFSAMRQNDLVSNTAVLLELLQAMQSRPRAPEVPEQIEQADDDTINQKIVAFTQHSPDASYILKGRIDTSEKIPRHQGDVFNVYKGSLKDSGGAIAMKVYREAHQDDANGIRAVERILRQVHLWTSFSHPSILPCLGMSMQITKFSDEEEVYDEFQLYLVSPWMKRRDAARFIKKHKQPLPLIDILHYIQQVAAGIQYLHARAPPCVHASIRGENVIIKDDNTACLNGFGFTKASQNDFGSLKNARYGNKEIELTGDKFVVRWMAPELLQGNQPLLLPSCDIWSWAMTVLELTTGEKPFYMLKNDLVVRDAIRGGETPQRADYPAFEKQCPQPDLMWPLLEKCWAQKAVNRPTIDEVVVELEMIESVQIKKQAAPHIFT